MTDQLEPSWRVVKGDEDDGVPFKVADRARVHATLIGASADRDLTWSRGSLLSQLTKCDSIPASLADAARAARGALDAKREEVLTQFDEVAKKAEAAAKQLGVRVASGYKADLDSDGINIRLGGLALHDGAIPLRQLGLGSKRMLATGLHKEGVESPHVTLLDEVEFGLEPHRIARVLKYISNDDTGQYFITTHSPVVLRELTVKNLHVVHSKNGLTSVVAADQPGLADSIQGRIRSKAEAFLAPRVVVCEGCTEVGFLRAVDAFWLTQDKNSFAYQGVALFDANGSSNIKSIVRDLLALSYDVAVVADSDDQKNFPDSLADTLRDQGVDVISWTENMCLEGRVFTEVPWSAVLGSIDVAAEFKGRDGLIHQVKEKYVKPLDSDPANWTESSELRVAIGKAANEHDWFKRTDKGEKWGEIIAPLLSTNALEKTDLSRKMSALRDWVDRA
ncbi:MAG TPA: AAA family ATPase [Gemmatimonadaceae bacterium]